MMTAMVILLVVSWHHNGRSSKSSKNKKKYFFFGLFILFMTCVHALFEKKQNIINNSLE